jgi:hypothetical protein
MTTCFLSLTCLFARTGASMYELSKRLLGVEGSTVELTMRRAADSSIYGKARCACCSTREQEASTRQTNVSLHGSGHCRAKGHDTTACRRPRQYEQAQLFAPSRQELRGHSLNLGGNRRASRMCQCRLSGDCRQQGKYTDMQGSISGSGWTAPELTS